MAKKILLIGPRACGKTKNAARIANFFGVHKIFEMDAATKGYALRDDVDALFICNKLPRGIRREHFDVVIEVNKEDIL